MFDLEHIMLYKLTVKDYNGWKLLRNEQGNQCHPQLHWFAPSQSVLNKGVIKFRNQHENNFVT